MTAPGRGATEDYSTAFAGPGPSPGAVRAGLCGLATVGAVLLLVAEFSPVAEVVVGSLDTVQRRVDAGDNHAHVLLAAVAGALLGAGLGWRRRRAAGPLLAALGVAALVVALAVDRPDTRAGSDVPEAVAFQDARARAGSALGLEIAGGLVLVAAGAGFARLDRRRPRARI